MKRMLSCMPSEVLAMNAQELKQSILASEGRIVMGDMYIHAQLVHGITNAEVLAAFGCDMICMNTFDCFDPHIAGLPETDDPIRLLQQLTGRPVGIDIEAVDPNTALMENRVEISKGRNLSKEVLLKLNELGMSFILITGNPGVGVTNDAIVESVKLAKKYFNGLIIAGKMNSSGVDEPVINMHYIKEYIDAGADVISLPAAGTCPGITEKMLEEACAYIKSRGALSLTTIGTSQEGSDAHTVRSFALSSKRAGADIQYLGDAGITGMATPEAILALSIAIRGKRHTYFKMAQSIKR